MNHEFYAHYPFALQDSTTQAFAMEWLGGKLRDLPRNWPELDDIQDPMQRIAILSQAIATPYKEQARMGTRKDSGGFRYWVEHKSHEFLRERLVLMKQLGLMPALPDLRALPYGSWAMQFTFTLYKPYLSRDDTQFYILDNPVKKEKIFQVPMMAASSWKGALRSTLMHTRLALKKDELDNEALARERLAQTLLFGDEKGEEPGQNREMAKFVDALKPEEARTIYEELARAYFDVASDKPLPHHAGRLRCYPTYFDRLGLEVINPHSREASAGEQPIYFECVPAGAQGVFTLLYVPFDLIGQPEDAVRSQVAADAQRLAQGLQAMFCTYGFGAKTSSGYGLAEETLEDAALVLNVPDKSMAAPKPSEPQLPPDIQTFRQDFPDEDFQLKPKAWRDQHRATNSERAAYTQAREAYRQYTEQLVTYEQSLSQWQAQANAPAPQLTRRAFTTFEGLMETARGLPIAQWGGVE